MACNQEYSTMHWKKNLGRLTTQPISGRPTWFCSRQQRALSMQCQPCSQKPGEESCRSATVIGTLGPAECDRPAACMFWVCFLQAMVNRQTNSFPPLYFPPTGEPHHQPMPNFCNTMKMMWKVFSVKSSTEVYNFVVEKITDYDIEIQRCFIETVQLTPFRVSTPPFRTVPLDTKLRKRFNSKKIWAPENSNHHVIWTKLRAFSVHIKRCWLYTKIQIDTKLRTSSKTSRPTKCCMQLSAIVKTIIVWILEYLWSNKRVFSSEKSTCQKL